LKRQFWSGLLGATQLIATIVLSAIAMHRCRNQWAFMLLAVWMLTTSICISALTISVPSLFSRDAKRNEGVPAVMKWRLKPDQQPQPRMAMMYNSNAGSPYFSPDQDRAPPRRRELFGNAASGQICTGITALWFCGCIMGVVAISTITIPQYEVLGPLWVVTAVFGGLIFLGPTIILLKCMYCLFCLECLPDRLLLASISVAICVFGLLWMDWTLELVTGNLVGVPAESATVLYWTYIAVKRLGLFSM
jgi:hypothetical protein